MESPYEGEGLGLMVIGLVGAITVEIWSIVDAVHVAKVKNLAFRDQNNTGLNLQLEPFVLPVQSYNSTKTQMGLRFTMSF
jgi:hypothetical protein